VPAWQPAGGTAPRGRRNGAIKRDVSIPYVRSIGVVRAELCSRQRELEPVPAACRLPQPAALLFAPLLRQGCSVRPPELCLRTAAGSAHAGSSSAMSASRSAFQRASSGCFRLLQRKVWGCFRPAVLQDRASSQLRACSSVTRYIYEPFLASKRT